MRNPFVWLVLVAALGCGKPYSMTTVTYAPGPFGGMDVYRPLGPSTGAAVIALHGGKWQLGGKNDMEPAAELLCPKGFTVFAPNYRLAPQHPWPAQLEDVAAAASYARTAWPNIDAKRFGALGISAGGHLALMWTECYGGRVVVSLSGEWDLTQPRAMLDQESILAAEFGADATRETLAAASPVSHVRADLAVLLFHPAFDWNVYSTQSDQAYTDLSRAGAGVQYVRPLDGDHAESWLQPRHKRVVSEFLEYELR